MTHTTSQSARRSVVLILAAIAVGSTLLAVAEADAQMILSIGGKEEAVTDGGFDYVSDDPFLSGGHLSAELEMGPGFYAGIEYNWATESHSPFFDTDFSLELDGLFVVSRFEHRVTDFFAPYVRAGAGVYYADMLAEVNTGNDREEREQQRWLPAISGVGGLQFTLPSTWLRKFFGISRGSVAQNLTVGFQLEVGYEWIASTDFDDLTRPEPDKEPDPDEAPLDAHGIGLGELSLSGPMSRGALVVRY